MVSHLHRLYNVFPFTNLQVRTVTDMVCGGKTYTVTQIQTYDSDNDLCVTHAHKHTSAQNERLLLLKLDMFM